MGTKGKNNEQKIFSGMFIGLLIPIIATIILIFIEKFCVWWYSGNKTLPRIIMLVTIGGYPIIERRYFQKVEDSMLSKIQNKKYYELFGFISFIIYLSYSFYYIGYVLTPEDFGFNN